MAKKKTQKRKTVSKRAGAKNKSNKSCVTGVRQITKRSPLPTFGPNNQI